MTVAGILLAAGRSRRFGAGRPKQLFDVGGEPMVRRIARTVLASRLRPVRVVLGHAAAEVGAALAGLDVALVENPFFDEGQSTSVGAGLHDLAAEVGAAVFVPADQPLLTSELLDRLADAWSAGARIVVPVAGRRRGAPVLFDRTLFGELAALTGDVGGRRLLPRYADLVVEISADPRELVDVDAPEDLGELTPSPIRAPGATA